MKSLIKNLFFRNSSFITLLLVANLILILTNIPLLLRINRTPNHLVYPLVSTTWAHDYYLYLSAITQGQHGSYLYRDAYTTEPTNPGVFYIFYIWVGNFTSLLKISPSIIYHLSIIISAELFIIFLYVLSSLFINRSYVLWAGLFSLLGTGFPSLLFGNYKSVAFPLGSNLDAFDRIYNIPHYLAAETLLLAGVASMTYYIRTRKQKFSLLAAVLILIGGVIFPAILLPIVFALPLSLLLLFITSLIEKKVDVKKSAINTIRKNLTMISGIFIILISAAISASIIKLQEQMGFPWNIWSSWNIGRWNAQKVPFNYQLLFTFGVLPLFSLPAIYRFINSKKLEYIFIAIWALLPFLLLPFVNILKIPKLRLVQDAPFVPLGILSAYTVFHIISISKKKILRILLIIIFLATSLPVSFFLLKYKIDFVNRELIDDPRTWHIYVPNSEFETIKFIEKNIPKESIIISNQRLGNIVPAFAPVISYFGHQTLTKDFLSKQDNVKQLFTKTLSEKEAKKFLNRNRIKYVIQGIDERKLGSADDLNYSFLKLLYQGSKVKLFKVL